LGQFRVLPVSIMHAALAELLRPTKHKIGHFRDVLASQSIGLVLKKLNLTQQKQLCIHNKIYRNIKWTKIT